MAYFPIFEPYDVEDYKPFWPMTEVRFEKGYRERRSHGFKLRSWKTQYLLLDNFNDLARPWKADHNYSIGNYVFPTTPNNYVYMSVVAGKSGSSEPEWPTTQDSSVADNTVSWVCFKDNQIEAVQQFVDDRRGGVGSYYAWIPLISTFVKMTFDPEGFPFRTIEGGYYGAVVIEVIFHEDF